MQIKGWKAEISILVTEGTDSARESYEITGGPCDRAELPAKVSAAVDRQQAFLGDIKGQAQRIAELEKKLALMREATLAAEAPAKAIGVAVEAPPASPAEEDRQLPPPVEEAPRKMGRRGKA